MTMIKFRAIEEDDLPMLKSWRNSDCVMPFCREYRYLSDYDQDKWFEAYQKSRRDSDWGQEIYIINCCENDIGVGGFTRIEWRNRRAELTFYKSNNCKELHFVDPIQELINIGFQRFNFNKITWPVYEHDPNLPIYKTILKEEAILKEEYFWDGKFWDRHYLSITEQEFRKKI